MQHDDDLAALPLIDDPRVKDVFSEFCTGLNFVHGNVHILCLGHRRSRLASSAVETDRLRPNCYADNRSHRA
jgi:hypothetical protein